MTQKVGSHNRIKRNVIYKSDRNDKKSSTDHLSSLLPHHFYVEYVEFTFTFLAHTSDEFIIQDDNHYAASIG